MADLIVIGGGIAGSAAALRAVQYHLKVVFIRGDKETAKRSRAQWVVNIDNMVGIHEGIVRKKALRMLRGEAFAAARAKIEESHAHISTLDIVDNVLDRLRDEYAEHVELVEAAATAARAAPGGGFEIDAGGQTYRAPYVVLATGVMDRQPFIKKTKREEIIDDPKWIYPFANSESVLYCIRCEGHLTSGTCTAVIGSSEDTAQIAMMLHERYGSACAILTNGEAAAWSAETQRALEVYGISVKTARITDVSGTKGQLHAIGLEDGDAVGVNFALVSLGLYRVYNELARDLGAALTNPEQPDELRHVQIDAIGETSVKNLFAIGDMVRRPDEPVMKQVYTSQEYAVRAVDAIDRRIRRKRREAALAK
jgi:thioredoxin reductase (NADPH)